MTLCPASTSRRAMCAPIFPRPMKPMSIVFLPSSLFLSSPTRGEDKFRAHRLGMLAERGHRTVAPRRRGVPFGRRRIGHRAAWRADGDAAQMRMTRKLGRRVDARECDNGGGKFLFERFGV